MRTPAILATLILFTSWTIAGDSFIATACAQESQEAVKQILNDCFSAYGGEEVLLSVVSIKFVRNDHVRERNQSSEKGAKNLPEATTKVTVSLKGKQSLSIDSRGTKHGFDGVRGWTWQKGGSPSWFESRTENETGSQIHPATPVYYLLDYPAEIKLLESEVVDERECYRLHLVAKSVTEPTSIRLTPTDVLIDAESKLISKVVFEYQAIFYDKYQNVDGIMIPFLENRNVKSAGLDLVYRSEFESIEINPKIDDDVFAIPEELMKKRK